MSTGNPACDVARAQRAERALHDLLLANIPTIDMKDRLSVLTVASGLRSVGVLETWGQRLPLIRDRLIQQGLSTSIATCVWSTIERPPDVLHRDVLMALDAKRIAGKPKHVLWFYSGTEERDIYRRREFTQQQAGSVLQYPPCCTAFESAVMNQLPKAQLYGLIEVKAHSDAELIREVRKANPLPAPKIPLPDNALRTEQRLPFALHVACDACLGANDSPSAGINARYSELVRQVDADFHALFLAVQETYCQIGEDQVKNRELLSRVRELHRRFFSHGS